MLPSTLQKRLKFFERLKIHHYTPTSFLSTHLQLWNSSLKWSTRESQTYLVIIKNYTKLNLPTNQHQRIKAFFHQCLMIIAILKALKGIETERLMVQPPDSLNMKTNIGRLFIRLLRKHFSNKNKRHKNFKLSTFKTSYCCTTNVGNSTKQRKSKVLSKTIDSNNRKCNCRSKPNCPLNVECLIQCLVYKAMSRTTFVTTGLLNESSKHSITTIQNLSGTVSAWLRLSHQNICINKEDLALEVMSFILIQTFTKEKNRICANVVTENFFCLPTLRK